MTLVETFAVSVVAGLFGAALAYSLIVAIRRST
jgi:hypothetical protein